MNYPSVGFFRNLILGIRFLNVFKRTISKTAYTSFYCAALIIFD